MLVARGDIKLFKASISMMGRKERVGTRNLNPIRPMLIRLWCIASWPKRTGLVSAVHHLLFSVPPIDRFTCLRHCEYSITVCLQLSVRLTCIPTESYYMYSKNDQPQSYPTCRVWKAFSAELTRDGNFIHFSRRCWQRGKIGPGIWEPNLPTYLYLPLPLTHLEKKRPTEKSC